MTTGEQSTVTMPLKMPPVVAGVSWSPRLQLQLFKFTDISYYDLTAVPQLIANPSPDRQALIIEYVSGSTDFAIRIGDMPNAVAPQKIGMGNTLGIITINAALQPGLPQQGFTAVALDDLGCRIRVWELVSNY